MTDEQQEQLVEALELLEQAHGLLLNLSESCMESADTNPDDEAEDTSNIGEELENIVVAIEEIQSSLNDLRDSL